MMTVDSLTPPQEAGNTRFEFREDVSKMLISPASVEMGGLVVAARLEDFERMTEEDLRTIFEEVTMSEAEVSQISQRFLENGQEPLLDVGIVSTTQIPFTFLEPFRMVQTGKLVQGHCLAFLENGKIKWKFLDAIKDETSMAINKLTPNQTFVAEDINLKEETCSEDDLFEKDGYDSLEFEAVKLEGARFELPEVKIGIGFHWERTEKQAFEGRLKFLVEGDKLTAVNRVPLESYLTSVISSEMSAKASGELLKAHAVISRSWLMAQIRQKGKNTGKISEMLETETERIKWYDREDHTLYDVCADDHCQRYQGITKASTVQVREAIRATRGQILVWEGEICDARFSKCCGGVMETFENCWENEPKNYLQGLADCDVQTVLKTPVCVLKVKSRFDVHSARLVSENQSISFPDLSDQANARAWILGTPPAFCNTTDKQILEQVLNNYDQETTDFYRWKVKYTTAEISRLACERSGIDFGEIQDLIPVERGVSGRLIKLRVVGSKRTVLLGKELEIR
ncbi:MAG: SpoIID/LytB domain-containing protein, partial [Bacteroidia bacterium]|nr:SpoIID/LytB domain-containing protein [Bacteroidia bacterium]